MIVMISRKENDAINIYGRRNCPSYGIVSEEIVFITCGFIHWSYIMIIILKVYFQYLVHKSEK